MKEVIICGLDELTIWQMTQLYREGYTAEFDVQANRIIAVRDLQCPL